MRLQQAIRLINQVDQSPAGQHGPMLDQLASLLRWARGVEDVPDGYGGTVEGARQRLSDALHTAPVLVNYGGTDSAPDLTVFMSTNEGYVHAFDSSTGVEQFAFMPKELLPNLDVLYRDVQTINNRPYGMDGSIDLWVNDASSLNAIMKELGRIKGVHAVERIRT